MTAPVRHLRTETETYTKILSPRLKPPLSMTALLKSSTPQTKSGNQPVESERLIEAVPIQPRGGKRLGSGCL
jgi:hypothetical protein